MTRTLMPPIDVDDNAWSHQDLNETGQVILAEPGTIETFDFFNNGGDTRSVLLFNAASAGDVTLGTTEPDLMFAMGSKGGISKSIPTHWSAGCVAFAIEGTDPTGTTGAGTNEVTGNALTSNRQS